MRSQHADQDEVVEPVPAGGELDLDPERTRDVEIRRQEQNFAAGLDTKLALDGAAHELPTAELGDRGQVTLGGERIGHGLPPGDRVDRVVEAALDPAVPGAVELERDRARGRGLYLD